MYMDAEYSRRIFTKILDELQKAYIRQLTSGCGRENCPNKYCASNYGFIVHSPEETARMSKQYSGEGIWKLDYELVAKFANFERAVIEDERFVSYNYNTPVVQPLTISEIIELHNKSHESRNFDSLIKRITETFSAVYALGTSFIQEGQKLRPNEQCVLDRSAVRTMYTLLLEKSPARVKSSLMNATQVALVNIRKQSSLFMERQVHAILIILENPILVEPEMHQSIIPDLNMFFSRASKAYVDIIVRWLSSFNREELQSIVIIFQQFLTMRIFASEVPLFRNNDVTRTIKTLAYLNASNNISQAISHVEFYNDALNEQIDVERDLRSFKEGENFSFSNYPFLLTPATKSTMLKLESQWEMHRQFHNAYFTSLFAGVSSPYLFLEVRREHIIFDALNQLDAQPKENLKKQVRVLFVGEEGVDEGGVRNEFFQLIVREIMDPKYGMFESHEDSHFGWFSSSALDCNDPLALDEYRLVGLVVGLAIYNGVILDLHFPMVLYKKLMNKTVKLKDLAELSPTLAKGLQELLEYPGDVQSTFMRTFEVELEVFGQRRVFPLMPGGSEKIVTNENRQEFVQLYVDFLLNKAVEKAFLAFLRGFNTVCADTSLKKLFRPEELESVVCGESKLDFQALEKVAKYDGGFDANQPIVKWFWEIVHDMTEDQKRKLLFFVTGNSRAPIGGLARMNFVVMRNGPDTERLPTAHTCFNILLLPEYRTKAKLLDRLLTAIQNAEGFGIR